MNNERYQQIIDEAYRNYTRSCIKETKRQENEMKEKGGWLTLCLTPYFESKDKFIELIMTDSNFSEKWGLKIEERELSFEERWELSKKYGYRTGDAEIPSPDSTYLGLNERQEIESLWNDPIIDTKLPTKLITITYNNETIEVYG